VKGPVKLLEPSDGSVCKAGPPDFFTLPSAVVAGGGEGCWSPSWSPLSKPPVGGKLRKTEGKWQVAAGKTGAEARDPGSFVLPIRGGDNQQLSRKVSMST
jgi:hypothetical protein